MTAKAKDKLTLNDRRSRTISTRTNKLPHYGRFSSDGKEFIVNEVNKIDVNYCRADEVVAAITKAAFGLSDAMFEIETDDEAGTYFSTQIRVYVSGHRKGTKEEYDEASRILLEQINYQSINEQKEIEKAQALLKKKGLL